MSVLGGKKCDCGLIRGYCNCFSQERKAKMSEQQWEEIKIEDVQPGDVARCNGREFPIRHRGGMLQCNVGELYYTPEWLEKNFGVTFHRKVKREPRTFTGKINCVEFDGQMKIVPNCILLPCSWPYGTRVRITELLDGEDGA